MWGERYHARALRTREVRNALVYILQNWRRHFGVTGEVDARSSAPWFDGWPRAVSTVLGPRPVVAPRTWLAAVGWRRLGLIGFAEGPARGKKTRSVPPNGSEPCEGTLVSSWSFHRIRVFSRTRSAVSYGGPDSRYQRSTTGRASSQHILKTGGEVSGGGSRCLRCSPPIFGPRGYACDCMRHTGECL